MDAQERSDSDIIIRMLYYCTEPRTLSQIMSYCGIDGERFRKYMLHCMKRDLLKMTLDEEGAFEYSVTQHGAEVLGTAAEIMGALGIEGDLK